jgi:esterase/lipase superfamily enzyme
MMLFITNRVFNEGNLSPAPGQPPRTVTFNLQDTNALQSLFYCERLGPDSYREVLGTDFLERLRQSPAQHLIIFVHGFSNFPENAIFQRAGALQRLFDQRKKNHYQVQVVQNYFNDQQAASASGGAYARALMRLVDWQTKNIEANNPCLKRVSLIAHSMGNRVLVESMRLFATEQLRQDPPMFLRHIFMVAADVVNEIFEEGQPGELLSYASGSVTSYFAADDMALRASKATNLGNGIASRRLGHTGPEDMARVPKNVFAVDCGGFNTAYDSPMGHSYFLGTDLKNEKSSAGECFKHIAETIDSGMVPQMILSDPRLVRLSKSIVTARKKAVKKTT